MGKTIMSLVMACLCSLTVNIQRAFAQTRTLKEVMTLHIDREGGANGANVAWHPAQNKYYAVMAGNEGFPMEIFDKQGKVLSDDQLMAMFDVRGVWYNPASRTLQANGYNDYGWAEYKLNSAGVPMAARKLSIVTSQPDPQSVAAYDAKNNVVYFLDYTLFGVERHKIRDGGSDTTISLHPGATSKNDLDNLILDDVKVNYNANALIYTGLPKAEIGLLNKAQQQIELYSIATGLMTQQLKLPDNAPTEYSLNFSYTNGMYWLFDKAERTWRGYK